MELLRWSDYRAMPWRNGGGTTYEIALDPPDASFEPGGFSWRLSIAEIERDGPFSELPGYTRIFTLLEGPGVRLEGVERAGEGRELFEVTGPFAQARFAGEIALTGRLQGAPVKALNLMARRADVTATARVMTVPAEGLLLQPSPGALALHALSEPGFSLERENGPLVAAAGETLLERAVEADRVYGLSAPRPAQLLVIEITAARPDPAGA